MNKLANVLGKKFFRLGVALFFCFWIVLSTQLAQAAGARRIVSLAPVATEILYSLGLGDDVVAVTRYCTWPPEARKKTQLGDMLEVNLEQIVALAPDCVVISDMNEVVRSRIEQMGYRTIGVAQNDFESICRSILALGDVFGVAPRARGEVASLQKQIAALREKTRTLAKPRVLVCVGRDVADASFRTLYVAGRKSFYQELLEMAGAENALDAGYVEYAALSHEGLLQLNPDVIIELIGEHGMANRSTDAELLAQWTALKGLKAAEKKRVAIIRGDFAFRAGPRYPQILRAFIGAIHPGALEK